MNDGDILREGTIIFGEQHRRVDYSDTEAARAATIEAQIACLKKLLTNRADKYVSS